MPRPDSAQTRYPSAQSGCGPDCPLDAASRVAEKIAAAIADIDFQAGGAAYGIGASIGITCVDENAPPTDELMRRADEACYTAKALGRGRVVVYEAAS